MDKKLLYEVMQVQSSVSDDKDMMKFIEKKLSMNKSVSISKDKFGNIYGTKGSGKNGYKCIVSHTDTVHSIKEEFYLVEINSILMAIGTENFSESSLSQTGVGGDDKCGVYTCLQAINDFDDIKVAFFRFEESGCNGSRNADMKFFEDCNFVVQCDRRGNSDFITSVNGSKIASKEFENEMSKIYTKYGFKSAYGLSTDVGALKRNGLNVSACNLSSGYHDPHSNKETVNIIELSNTYDMVCEMFETYGDRRFDHKREEISYTKRQKTYTGGWSIPMKSSTTNFSRSIHANFFTSGSFMFGDSEIEIEEYESECKDFTEIANTGMFKYAGDSYVDLENCACPNCKSINTLILSAKDLSIYCSSSSCHGISPDESSLNSIYEKCIMKSGDKTFVLDNTNNVWLDSLDSVWNKTVGSYVTSLK